MWERLRRPADAAMRWTGQCIGPACRAFLADRQGVAAVFFVLALVPISAAAGAAIDISRAYLVKHRLGIAIDAAGLAVGASSGKTEAELNQVLQDYFNANYPAEKLGVPATPVMVIEDSVIKISAKASVDTTLMRVVQISEIEVEASTEIIRETKGLDVVLVLDNTGSMSGSKLTSLKIASKQFVEILFGDNAEAEDLLIGVVPFAGTVNVGTAQSFTDDFIHASPADSAFSPDHWRGCVEARTAPHDQQDTNQITGGKWTKYLWPDNSSNRWSYLNGSQSNHQYYGPNKQCPVELLPLTNQKATITGKIDEMIANGLTHINVGAVWGWRVLSPSSPYTGGHAYDDPDYNKAIVIMTDGQNTSPSGNTYTGYGFLSDGKLGTTYSSYTAQQTLNSRLSTICTNIKAKNVLVYTITFQVSSSSTRTLLRNCATDAGKYFNSPSNSELEKTFRAIGAELSNLRIGK